jgi:hypothetical protein
LLENEIRKVEQIKNDILQIEVEPYGIITLKLNVLLDAGGRCTNRMYLVTLHSTLTWAFSSDSL